MIGRVEGGKLDSKTEQEQTGSDKTRRDETRDELRRTRPERGAVIVPVFKRVSRDHGVCDLEEKSDAGATMKTQNVRFGPRRPLPTVEARFLRKVARLEVSVIFMPLRATYGYDTADS